MTPVFLFPAVSYIHAMKGLRRIYGLRWKTRSWGGRINSVEKYYGTAAAETFYPSFRY
jgi:hypothetical protein